MTPRVERIGDATLWLGDNREALDGIAEASIDSCVTDPPYNLNFMGKEWDRNNAVFKPEVWKKVARVLKPGAHLVAFGGTRTYHRLACAIEDAGFEIRDAIMWHYGQGFPKSLDVSAGIDDHFFGEWLDAKPSRRDAYVIEMRAARATKGDADKRKAVIEVDSKWRELGGFLREVVGITNRQVGPKGTRRVDGLCGTSTFRENPDNPGNLLTAPATPEAAEWAGYGTALKPATEIICLARKPLSEDTVAANVLKWGTGALNIDGCRIEGESRDQRINDGTGNGINDFGNKNGGRGAGLTALGRWPANIIHDGSEEVLAAFPDAPGQGGAVNGREPSTLDRYILSGLAGNHTPREPRNDSGSAARFFYTAKADSDDRLGSKHPTVKPVDLMQWLVRLVTPPGGLILDPFAGTGTTAEAAIREGFKVTLIEREPEYQEDIRRRLRLVMAGPIERRHESIKTRGKTESAGPLFGDSEMSRGGQADLRPLRRGRTIGPIGLKL